MNGHVGETLEVRGSDRVCGGKEPYLRTPVLADPRNIQVRQRWDWEGEWGDGQPHEGRVLLHLIGPGEARRWGSAHECYPVLLTLCPSLEAMGSHLDGLWTDVIEEEGAVAWTPEQGMDRGPSDCWPKPWESSSWSGDRLQQPGSFPHDSWWPWPHLSASAGPSLKRLAFGSLCQGDPPPWWES